MVFPRLARPSSTSLPLRRFLLDRLEAGLGVVFELLLRAFALGVVGYARPSGRIRMTGTPLTATTRNRKNIIYFLMFTRNHQDSLDWTELLEITSPL